MDSRPNTDSPARSPSSGRPPLWKRQWIVDGAFQWSLVSRALTQTLVTLLFVSIGIFGPIVSSMAAQHGSDDQATVMLYMHSRFWWIAAASMAFAGIGTLIVSHRIAGPMVRFKRNLRWLAEGRLPAQLRTRERDHMKDEVACLNAAVAGVTQRIESLRTAHAEVTAALQRCSTELDTGTETTTRTALQAAAAATLQLGNHLDAFRRERDTDAERSPADSSSTSVTPRPAN